MRRDLYSSEPGERWRGLICEVTDVSAPPLRVEVSPERRFRIVQEGRPLIWCRVLPDWWGVEVAWDQLPKPVLPPLRADAARSINEADGARWMQRWAHRMLSLLMSSTTGPLHAGRWTVRPMGFRGARCVVPLDGMQPIWTDVGEDLRGEGNGQVAWGVDNASQVLPLRALSVEDAPRVKAYRKLVVERLLPPVVVWWVAGLATPVILDGHDRFVAARAEGFAPPMLCISNVLSVEDARERGGWNDLDEISRLERVLAAQPNHLAAHEALARRVARALAEIEDVATTRAWLATAPPEAWPENWS